MIPILISELDLIQVLCKNFFFRDFTVFEQTLCSFGFIQLFFAFCQK